MQTAGTTDLVQERERERKTNRETYYIKDIKGKAERPVLMDFSGRNIRK